MKSSVSVLILLLFFCSEIFAQRSNSAELIQAIETGDLEKLGILVNDSNINQPLSNNQGFLINHAIDLKKPAVVQFLLQKRADPNLIFNSRTPLMFAVQNQNIEIVRLLLKFGAAINFKDSQGNTALMVASTGEKLNIVKLLIRKGAELNCRNKKGLNARDFAIRSNNRTIAAYLKNVFERNLPNYFDGPYVSYVTKRKIKVSYLIHDSLRRKSESKHRYYKLKNLDGNQFTGFSGDQNVYPLVKKFEVPPTEINHLEKLLIIGDVHGQYDTLQLFLRNNKIIDENLHWNFGKGTVVFIGDIFDRGEKVTEALWLIYKLEIEAKQHGGSVQMILGNHEIMVLNDDHRYIADKYYYLFKDLKISYTNYFNTKSQLGKWIRSKNTFLKIDSMLFVHGGIHPSFLNYNLSVDSTNKLINKYINIKHPATLNHLPAVQFLFSLNGPFWYRGMVDEETAGLPDEDVSSILKQYNVKHIIVGHTFKPEIKKFNHGQVISTDVPFYLPDGYPMQALLLEDQKFVILNSQGERKAFVLP